MSFDMERAQKLLDAVNSGAVKSSELRPDDASLLNSYLDTKIAERKPLAPAAPKPTEQRGGLLGFFDRLRAKNTETVAKQAERLGGKLDVSAAGYAKTPEVARGLAKGISSMPPVSLLMPKDERAKLGNVTTTAGKVAEGVGGFIGGIPLDVALSPIGGRAAAKVGTTLTNPLARAAVKGAARGATEVGLTEVVKQGVDAVRGENVTPASAAKQIGGAVLGGGILGGALGAGFEKLGQVLGGKAKATTTPLTPQKPSVRMFRGEMAPDGVAGSKKNIAKAQTLLDVLGQTDEGLINRFSQRVKDYSDELAKVKTTIADTDWRTAEPSLWSRLNSEKEQLEINIETAKRKIAELSQRIGAKAEIDKIASENSDLLFLTPQRETAESYAKQIESAPDTLYPRPEGYRPTVREFDVALDSTLDLTPFGRQGVLDDDESVKQVLKALGVPEEQWDGIFANLEGQGYIPGERATYVFKMFRGKNLPIVRKALQEGGFDSVRYAEGPQDNYLLLNRGKATEVAKAVNTEDDAADFILSRVSTDKPSKTMPTLERLYSRFVDRLQPIKRATAALADDALPESQNPFSLARVSRGWAGKADSMLTAGVYDNAGAKVADSLQDVLKPVADDLPKFRAYAVARRAVELAGREITTGFDATDAAKSLELLETPTRKQAFEALVKFQDAVLDETMLRSGMMSKEAVNAMRELNKQYVPFHRVFDAAEMGQKGVADTFANIGQVVKKLQGSERDIVDPLESVIKNTYALTSAAERNKVGAALATLVEGNVDKAMPWMQKVDDVTSAAMEGVVSVWRNGQRELYKVDPDLYAALTHLDKESSNLLVKVLSTPASWLRAGATLTPEFIGRNPIRDQWTAFLNSKYGYTPFADLGRGISEAIKKGSLYDEFQRSGAAQSTLASLDRAYLQKSLSNLTSSGSAWDKAKRLASSPLDALRGLSELMEEGTRIGAFKKAKDAALKAGSTYEDALLKAAQEAREITLDFGRRGSQMGQVNRVIAFFNATVQGADKMVRAIKENPTGYLSKAAVSITLPSLALWYRNKDDPRYKELPQWQKDLFWIVLTKDKIIRIPKPFEAGVIFGTAFERMAEWMDKKDPEAFKGLGKTLQEGFSPSFIPTAFVPWISVYSNKSLFTGAPIVPQRELGLPAPMQFGAYTSETAKGIGALTGQSPRQIEEYVQGYAGGLGRLGLQAGDAVLDVLGQGSKIPKPATDWTSLPGVRGFTIQPYQQSQSVNEFYETLDKLQTQQAGMKAGGERMQPKDTAMLMRLNEANKTMSELNKQERAIQESTRLTPEQKRQQLDALNKRQADLARKALKR